MATTAVDKVFLDTNILIYAQLALSPLHSAAVTRLHDLRSAGAELWISRQIMREYLAVLTRPGVLTAPIPAATLLADVHAFATAFSSRRMVLRSPTNSSS